MAGNARPNIEGLGNEVTLNIISSKGTGSVDGLFDGTCVNEWNTSRVFYWNVGDSAYIEFSTDKPINIWRCGTTSWASAHYGVFIIYKQNELGVYEDITSEIEQYTSPITEKQWEKSVSRLPEGTYKFVCPTTRIDSEWYVEEYIPPVVTPLSFHKVLKDEIPTSISNTEHDEIYFTEDGGIYLSKNDGTLRQIGIDDETKDKIQEIDNKINDLSQNGGTGDVINNITINEMSNPLTMNPLDYGYFKLSANVSNYVANSNILFDTMIDGNMSLQNGLVRLNAGKTYKIDFSTTLTHPNANAYAVAIGIYNNDTGEKLLACNQVAPTYSVSMSDGDLHGIITPIEDIDICVRCNYDMTTIGAGGTNFVVQEIRNNPVNQYGGFETEVLFDGMAIATGEYELGDDINKYSLLLVETELESNQTSVENVSIVKPMTSNTTPSPYVVTASIDESNAFKVFDNAGVNTNGNLWYASTTTLPQWLMIDMGAKNTINGFSITNGSSQSNYHSYPPKDVLFEGSNDGTSFDVIGTYTLDKLNADEEVTLNLTRDVSYRYYRWTFLSGHTTGGIIVSEIKLINNKNIEKERDIVSNIIAPNTMDNHHLLFLNKEMTMKFKDNKMMIIANQNSNITKIVGIKGQIPSLLIGGEF